MAQTAGEMKTPIAPYPALRMRRLRQADWIRRLVRETTVRPSDLIWSMILHDGEGRVPVPSMPGVERLSPAEAAKAAVQARELGIPAIAVFPYIDGELKDARGSEATNRDGLVCRAVKAMKDAAPEVGVMCDVALDPFTDHGHDGRSKVGASSTTPPLNAWWSRAWCRRRPAATSSRRPT
jgi:porphobilinogen synthase